MKRFKHVYDKKINSFPSFLSFNLTMQDEVENEMIKKQLNVWEIQKKNVKFRKKNKKKEIDV